MSDPNDLLRKLAGVRRDLEDLEKDISAARGAMPSTNNPSDAGRHNFKTVLDRLERIEEGTAETADKLRDVLKALGP